MAWDDFGTTHSANAWWAHANAEFLVYHRAMVHMMELALESVNWFGGVVYLDESLHQVDWPSMDLFSDRYFGVMGQPGQCLTTGQFTTQFKLIPTEKFPLTCLDRCGSGVFWSADMLNANLANATNYEAIRYDDTLNFHATGHGVLGGSCSMGDPSWSPRDPIFYFHHGFVDKHYWKWQNLCPSYKRDYEGRLKPAPGTTVGQEVNPNSPLDSWSHLTAAMVFDTDSDPMCYTYTKSGGDTDYTAPNCPDGSRPNYNPYYQGAIPPVRFSDPPAFTKATATATNSAKATATATAANWVVDMLTGFVAPPSTPRRDETSQALVIRDDSDYDANNSYCVTPLPDGSTKVNVTANGESNIYNVPKGCELYKAYFSHISILPVGHNASDGMPMASHCPTAMYPGCDDYVCERYPGFQPPQPDDPGQYPSFLTDAYIKVAHNLDACNIRASDCRVMWIVDEINAKHRAKKAQKQ
ncbi:Di-copper centre-containing protein [Rhizoclosmatium globosum]|uniref:Di-copper centre-containing protein n=1 Tax=Rhizoclosmatium globosum TaxID=329046 RepID=A0A1Y2CTX0_9FUNG|nr:Di-copper centre-containing protein [Rhizoclosmatium globosum]|eukprot:ORY50473.1 Di-copper centre-containing protein [Rhizoclosmatium globosum]